MLQAWPGLRVPGVWDAFELAVRAVLGQRLMSVDTRPVIARLVRVFGRPIQSPRPGLTHLFPRPAILAEANLASVGIPPARAETLLALARAAVQGKLNPSGCTSTSDIVARLGAIPGMARCRASYITMRAFGEPDAFPSGERGLRRVLTFGRTSISEHEFLDIAEKWRPWRAYAAMHLWATAMENSAVLKRSAASKAKTTR